MYTEISTIGYGKEEASKHFPHLILLQALKYIIHTVEHEHLLMSKKAELSETGETWALAFFPSKGPIKLPKDSLMNKGKTVKRALQNL